MALHKLFENCRIGTMEVRNRIIMPPITSKFASSDGFVTDQMKNYYEARAKGGIGTIVVEDAIVESTLGRHMANDICIDDDKFLPGLTELACCIKAHGAMAIQHLNHGGARAGKVHNGYLVFTQGKTPVAPSSVIPQPGYALPRELSIEEIEELIDKYATAALRAKKAGFDGVGLHCSHCYLLQQFISPAFNKRNDEYGEDAEGRLRFVLRIIEEIRKKVGQDYPLIARISGEEPIEGGLTLEEMKWVARRMEQAGIDAFVLSRGTAIIPPKSSSNFIYPVAPMRSPRGCMVYLAEGIKQAVKVPVTAVNRINDPVLAEQILEEDRADLIGMGRAVIADPELPNKAKEGRFDEIRKCIACLACLNTLHTDSSIICAINAQVGREKVSDPVPVNKPKKVLVVGGGPGGMEAARVAAGRGHQVELWERDPRLGGQLLTGQLPPGKEEIDSLIKYLESAVKRAGVKVKTDAAVTAENVKKLSPDVVIVATGAKPLIPQMPGINKDHVSTAVEVLSGVKDIKDKVAIIGGGSVGTEVAEYLAEKGKEVTIIEMLDQLAKDLPAIARQLQLIALEENNVKIVTEATVQEITDTAIIASQRGEKVVVPADSVVLALGYRSDTSLKDELEGQRVLRLGDCVKPRKILDAIREGFDTGAAV